MFKIKVILLIGNILLNFSLQSLNPINLNFENYYEWNGTSQISYGFIVNKLIRLGLNLIGLNLMINSKLVNRNILTLFFFLIVLLLGIYLTSFFWLISIELSKFLNPILFSPLLLIGTLAYKLASKQEI